MPLTTKGQEILSKMREEYGQEKGTSVFYASRNAGKITGVDAVKKDEDFMGGRKDAEETAGEQQSEDARMSSIESRLSTLERIGDAVVNLVETGRRLEERADALGQRHA